MRRHLVPKSGENVGCFLINGPVVTYDPVVILEGISKDDGKHVAVYRAAGLVEIVHVGAGEEMLVVVDSVVELAGTLVKLLTERAASKVDLAGRGVLTEGEGGFRDGEGGGG